jgi:hypothetical protein
MAGRLSPVDGSEQIYDEDTQCPQAPAPTHNSQRVSQGHSGTHIQSTISGLSQGSSNLNWIDENERRENSEKLKRKVRSHVRRGSHARQRRLNEAARPRPHMLGARRLVQKNDGAYAGISISPDQQPNTQPRNFIAPQPMGNISSISGTDEPPTTRNVLSNQIAASLPRTPTAGSVYFPIRDTSSWQEISLNSPSASLLPRQHFNNSKFLTIQLIQI